MDGLDGLDGLVRRGGEEKRGEKRGGEGSMGRGGESFRGELWDGGRDYGAEEGSGKAAKGSLGAE